MPIDDQVEQAMRRWPNVPSVHGWLRLDRRGRWMLIDRGRPGFDETRDGQGSEITSPPILDFLGRNYRADEQGRWHWQNGPQRVFVDIDLAPLLVRVLGDGGTGAGGDGAGGLVTHTGFALAAPSRAWMDGEGNLFLETELGPAAVHDLDLAQLDFEGDGPLPERVRLAGQWLTLGFLDDAAAALGFQRRPRG